MEDTKRRNLQKIKMPPPPAPTTQKKEWKKRQSPMANQEDKKQGSSSTTKPKRRRHKKKTNVKKEQEQVKEEEEECKMDVEVKGERSATHLTDVSFDSIETISLESKKAIRQVLKYENLTKVQHATLDSAMEGKDLVAKAKTGTGKTVGFLLPIVERIKQENSTSQASIDGLILSPTRELAMQIAKEAEALTKFHDINIAFLIGGTSMNQDRKKLDATRGVGIIVATPGRLIDHLDNDTQNLTKRLGSLRTLVLDEADRLLDMGFKPSLEKILRYLPEERQTLLYSATFPASVKQISKIALKPNYTFIDTIEEGDQQTNAHVAQESIICTLDNLIGTLETTLLQHIASNPDYKVIVFFNTARVAGYMAQLFNAAKFNTLEMHSRKSQSYRVKVAKDFHANKSQIMFSSDVSARGVDYPDVTLIVQVGLTEREQYIHRLGRTGRAGRMGRGVLLLCDFEAKFLDTLRDLDIKSSSAPTFNPNSLRTTAVIRKMPRDLQVSGSQAYQAFLGYYNSNLKRMGKMDRPTVVGHANHFSRVIGFEIPPSIQRKTARKMNLDGVFGLRLENNR